ncbi:MAG TPA: hypothetical protein VFN10_14265 [Thermoanaerobaculia bacterium]|nr:hypothetical protein [Thermoanaerobaculia bacterium]
MTVTEVGPLHARYVRVADRFKAIWTYHQFATGIFRNFLDQAPPYTLDFKLVYEGIKTASGKLNAAQANDARAALDGAERAVGAASKELLKADDAITPSLVRRFFEKLNLKDEELIYFLVKFYLYADAVEGDRRDKIDFLFTRIGEELLPGRGEYISRESLEFREKLIALLSVLRVAEAPRDEVISLIRAIRSMRDEVLAAKTFDDLTSKHLLKNSRTFKHRIGDLYFDPDVLLAVVQLNVASKNRFAELYQAEEQRILDDSQKLLRHGEAIERNFGETNPELAEAIARFREYKERFDALRAESNVKHDLVAQLKLSIGNVLAQLDRGLTASDEEVAELPDAFFDQQRQTDSIGDLFGRNEPLLPVLVRIAGVLDYIATHIALEEAIELPAVRELRLETWEVAAYQKLFARMEPDSPEDNDELWTLYLRAAALRIKVDQEATALAMAGAAGVKPDADVLTNAKQSLDCAKTLDELFGDLLQEAVYYSNPKILHQLYRSRFRLLRGFSGLWLIYDQQA